MKKLILFFSILLVKNISSQNITLDWAHGFGGVGPEGEIFVIDNNGDLIIAGQFENTVDFDPSSGTNAISSYGLPDAFFSKFDANGNYIFTKRIGGTGHNNVLNCAIDKDNNIYLTGQLLGTFDFDPSSGVYNLTQIGFNNVYIAKYDSMGNLIYAKQFGSITGDINISGIKIEENDFVITGALSNTMDFDPSTNDYLVSATGNYEGFFAKYSLNCDLIFVKHFTCKPNYYTHPYEALTDDLKNIYLYGVYRDSTDFDPSVDTFYLPNCINGDDLFFAKYDSLGNFIFAKGISSEYGYFSAMQLDSSGNIYLAGQFIGSSPIDFDPSIDTHWGSPANSELNFLAKYSTEGDFVFVNVYEANSYIGINDIFIDSTNTIFLTGSYYGASDFDCSSSVHNITASPLNLSAYIASYSETGDFLFAEPIISTNETRGRQVFSDNGNIYVAGQYKGTCDFDPSSNSYNITSNGQEDIFLAKYTPNPIGIKEIKSTDNYFGTPNPFSEYISFEKLKSGSFITIYDEFGRMILKEKLSSSNKINTSGLPQGCYIIEISDGSSISTQKMIKI